MTPFLKKSIEDNALEVVHWDDIIGDFKKDHGVVG